MMGMKYLREEGLVLAMVSESREGMAGQQVGRKRGQGKAVRGYICCVILSPGERKQTSTYLRQGTEKEQDKEGYHHHKQLDKAMNFLGITYRNMCGQSLTGPQVR